MDVLNRDELERKLARVLGRDMRAELDKLMRYLGDPPDMRNIPHEYWQNGWRDIQKDVEPVLLDIFLQQAEGLMAEIGIGADWAMINTTAARWASEYTYDLVQGVLNTTRDGVTTIMQKLQETIPEFYEEGLNLGELRKRLERYFSPVRAEMIAVTETTRAAVEGERVVVDRLFRESGIAMVPTWITKNDERVCPICGPKHGKEITDNVFPPAHPRCRCSVGWDFARDNQ